MAKFYSFIVVLFLFSFSVNGQEWVKKFTSENAKLTAQIVLPYDSAFFVSCYALDTINNSFSGTILGKIDSIGNPMWAKKFRFSETPFIASIELIKTIDGNLLFLLKFEGKAGVMKTDTLGNFIWGKSFEMDEYASIYKMEETINGDIVLAGYNEHANFFGNGFILWLDQQGTMLHYYDFVSPFAIDAQVHITDVVKTSDGGCMAIGVILKDSLLNSNILLVKMDSTGEVSWTRHFGDGGSQIGTSIVEITDGFIYSGHNEKELLLGKTDLNGKPVWNKTYHDVYTRFPGLNVTDEGIEIVSHTSVGSIGTEPLKFAVLNTDSAGNFLSGNLLPEPYADTWMKFAVAAYGVNAERIILRQEHEGGFKLVKSDTTGNLPDCIVPVTPSAVISNIFQDSLLNCTIKDTMPLESFTADVSPYVLKSETVCACPPENLTHELLGCKNEQLQLVSSGNGPHIWNTGQTSTSISVTQPDLYWVKNSSICTPSDTFQVSYADPLAEFTTYKKYYTMSDIVQLMNTSLNAITYKWDFGDGTASNEKNPSHSWSSLGEHWITLTASYGHCSDIYRMKINIWGLIAPNVFTPNNDGVNDRFILQQEGVDKVTCSIFNRWGNKVYEFNDPETGWDGVGYNEGVYFYVVNAVIGNNEQISLKGHCTLLR